MYQDSLACPQGRHKSHNIIYDIHFKTLDMKENKNFKLRVIFIIIYKSSSSY